MLIRVFSAVATGQTELVAFDAALRAGGVADFNLIKLSSVIPPGSQVCRSSIGPADVSTGDRLYCVWADRRQMERGGEAWAGLAWSLGSAGQGGVFAEAVGSSESAVRDELGASMAGLMAGRADWKMNVVEEEIAGIRCEDVPVCALAFAAFTVEPWPGEK